MSSFDLGFSSNPVFMPDSISTELTPTMFSSCPESVKDFARAKRTEGWRFYVVNQTRGRCYADAKKVITIPTWVYRKSQKKIIWYISHELAHAYDECKHSHGPEFMEWLKKICPSDCIHYELEYKPRNAASAGILFEL